ncbi:SDR family oxidoreductase [Caloramator proteoclasticus]|uniref:NAD(P)-dependent dehydrogenase, short-chain alcohol dehydrogenase family n=1 Tax=Caloramator proteoclasticus DSM 10124 TaxID=1121262 RepID=A0A1M4YZJ9_9CLOT|nr:SDR family oxidoreductase [Caloramator proteoclasticus]SHF10746.1 NAD(P)-dependent dehydrogenase, short-chain alcohol dehydrogenase family [Caloramator proteoclasticus DSM 10124]
MKKSKKTAIITGGGQGIGKGTAKRLLMENYNVVIAEIDKEAGQETVDELKIFGDIKFICCDVSKEEDVKNLVSQTVNIFGGIDVLINNAAISINKPITELSLEEWNRVISINLTGAFLCSKYCAPYLKQTKGSIINIASTRAFMSEKDTEAYSASKGGIFALTHALAVSLGPDVRVNCISPGWIEVSELKKQGIRKTPILSEMDNKQHPAGRVGNVDDVASMILFLIDERNSFITGANFIVDGGMTRKMIYV